MCAFEPTMAVKAEMHIGTFRRGGDGTTSDASQCTLRISRPTCVSVQTWTQTTAWQAAPKSAWPSFETCGEILLVAWCSIL